MSFKARHIWLFEKINHYLRLGGLEVVEDEFRPPSVPTKDANYDTLESFLGKHGSRTLFVSVQKIKSKSLVVKSISDDEDRKVSDTPRDLRRLVCSAECPKSASKVVYFVRRSTDTSLNPLIADDDSIDCGVIQGTAMESLEAMLTTMVRENFHFITRLLCHSFYSTLEHADTSRVGYSRIMGKLRSGFLDEFQEIHARLHESLARFLENNQWRFDAYKILFLVDDKIFSFTETNRKSCERVDQKYETISIFLLSGGTS